jgi:hypothetical protein
MAHPDRDMDEHDRRAVLKPESDAFVAFATDLFRAIFEVAEVHRVSFDRAVEIVARAQGAAPAAH